MIAETSIVAEPNSPIIVMTRVFDAPAALVFKAMTTPDLVARWWGPRGYETTVVEHDLRVGGAWRFVQRTPDGTEHGFRGEFREIVPGSKVVQTFIWDGFPDAFSVETMTLVEVDGKTHFRSESLYPSVQYRDMHLKNGMEGGARETMDRLEELLTELS